MPMQRVQTQSLVGELRSCILCGAAKKELKKKKPQNPTELPFLLEAALLPHSWEASLLSMKTL